MFKRKRHKPHKPLVNVDDTVDGSEIRRSPPGMVLKPMQIMGRTTNPSTGEFTVFLKHQQYDINFR